MTRKHECGVCYYGKSLPRQKTGVAGQEVIDLSVPAEVLCRRYPPQFTIVPHPETGQPMNLPQWPKMTDDCWCGEFVPRETDG